MFRTRLSKIYVPIDIELIAEKFGVDSEIIFGRLYYYLDKKYSYKNEDGSIAKFFVNSLHAGSSKEKHLINFPLLDIIVSENNTEIVSHDPIVEVAPDWSERILLALFEKRNTSEFYNLFLLTKNESEKETIRINCKELQSRKLIDFDPNHSSFRSKPDVKTSERSEIAHEQRLEKYHNELGAKINLKGVEHVKVNVLKRQLNSSHTISSTVFIHWPLLISLAKNKEKTRNQDYRDHNHDYYYCVNPRISSLRFRIAFI